ncbi:MAG: hypothetical protein P0Y49_16250 [Candidatus Pedobacter colombiensis]|uniref:Uncharacterized protein n=1 Tax=Candidatus Pedobacter colombiensis TaxID=3121371 RepID=A0AAJ5W8B3_9SPHI|nr:hypothetical protein [Pedobacter sp.]WEK18342.1 MAG: hypothetical protein P0Y49_16250 [Pedobacter sp.]
MLDDYKKAVIFDYHQKKVKRLLSLNLSHPTPAKLRHECLLVLNTRPQIKDEKIIRDFFNLGAISNDYSSSIERFDPEKLKPLDNYLKGKTVSTEPRNIELLAWLIDFEPRPYQYGVIYATTKELPAEEIKDIKEVFEPEQPKPERPEKEESKILAKYGIDIIILLITIIGGIGLSMRNASIERTTTAYICTSKVAKKYHLNAKCHGLNNCKSEIVPTTIAKAKDGGKTLCEIEH